MSRKLAGRIARIEGHKAGPAVFFVGLPHDAWEHGHEHLERVVAETIREHRARTGYQGAVLVGPQECMSAEEWTERYCRTGHGKASRDGAR